MAIDTRPVFLDLRRIRLPINAVVSILHRITGVLLIVSIPLLLWLMALSLSGPEGFQAAAALLKHPLGSLALLLWLWMLIHHFFVGIRFLLLEIGIGETREGARKSAWIALVAGVLAAIAVWGVLS